MIDALLSVFIVICMCGLCFNIYKAITNYEKGYENYLLKSDETVENILLNLEYCESCVLDESD